MSNSFDPTKPHVPIVTTVKPDRIITVKEAELQRLVDELQKVERDLYRRFSRPQTQSFSSDLKQHCQTVIHAATAALGVAYRELNREIENPGSTNNKVL